LTNNRKCSIIDLSKEKGVIIMNEITKNQATEMMDTICQKICAMIGRTLYLTGGEISTLKYLTPEIQETTRECFCEICETLEVENVSEN
jgi:hypothetical protein